MRIAPFVVGIAVTSVAAFGFASSQVQLAPPAPYDASVASLEAAARSQQRARIQLRYEAQRARCDALRGPEHDRCLIDAHAWRGRALFEAAAPYQAKS